MDLLVGADVGVNRLGHVVGSTTVYIFEELEYVVALFDDELVDGIKGHHQKASAFAAIAVVAPLLEE